VEKAFAGIAVFLAVVCGKPDLLGVICLYLISALLIGGMVREFLRPARGS
jgi:hypothetical protein